MIKSKENNPFIELSNAQISEARHVVISKFNKGGYTLAQQLKVQEGDKTVSSFMKGTIQIESLDGLYGLRDAVNMAINVAEELQASEGDTVDWDEE